MTGVGSESQPLRVAIVGAGAAGFYTIAQLLRRAPADLGLEIDLFEKLPSPYGLVRSGVAPDHQKDKTVTKVFAANGMQEQVRYYGGLTFGVDFSLRDLRRYYHQIVITTGAGHSRALGIPGEDLQGAYAATDFVGWYNAHPDFQNLSFNLNSRAAAIIGVGNVSVDIARVLAKTPADLAPTDIAAHALAGLGQSKVRDIYLIGRRGPAQAAFTPPEIKALGQVDGVQIVVPADEAQLDPISEAWLQEAGDKKARTNVQLIQQFAEQGGGDAAPGGAKPSPAQAARVRIHLRFWWSPVALEAGDDGRLGRLVLEKTRAKADGDRVGVCGTGEMMHIDTALVFRSVGYRATPLPEMPFDDKRLVIPNAQGRVLDDASPLPGLYTAGWIKRGPTGIIGSNKTCAGETVRHMLEDAANGDLPQPPEPSRTQIQAWLAGKRDDWIDFEGWQQVDAEEIRRGEAQSKIREKYLNISEMLAIGQGR